jgi:prolyl-tRNA synthetase
MGAQRQETVTQPRVCKEEVRGSIPRVSIQIESSDDVSVAGANIAPADVHLVRLGDDAAVVKAADKLFEDLKTAGKDVLYDDRNESVGRKFTDADLIGVPVRLTVSKRTLEQDSAELKHRTLDDEKLVKLGGVIRALA